MAKLSAIGGFTMMSALSTAHIKPLRPRGIVWSRSIGQTRGIEQMTDREFERLTGWLALGSSVTLGLVVVAAWCDGVWDYLAIAAVSVLAVGVFSWYRSI